MNIGTAVAIFEQLDSDNFTEVEKIIAIHTVANMPTHNSISKAKILNALKWLVENDWEFEGETNGIQLDGKQTNELDDIL